MQSVHDSRGRILFEVLCALVISASCVGAWLQTGAWALLPAAGAALVHALIHSFDLARRSPAVAAVPQRMVFATEEQDEDTAKPVAGLPLVAADEPPAADSGVEEAVAAEPTPPKASAARRAKPARKGGRRPASAAKEAKIIELARPEEPEVAEPAPPDAVEVAEPAPPEDVAHIPLEPLFEPEPFVRQQRAVFGRKA